MKLGHYKAFMPVYIEKGEDWVGVTIAGRQTNEKGKIGLFSQWTMDGWDEQQNHNKRFFAVDQQFNSARVKTWGPVILTVSRSTGFAS